MKSMNVAIGMALPAAGIAPVIFGCGFMQNADFHAPGNHTTRAKCRKYESNRAGTCQANRSSTVLLAIEQRQNKGLKEIERNNYEK